MNEFYTFRAEAVDEPTSAELLIFDAIGNWEDIGEVSAKAFARDLAKLPSSVKRLDIHINSPGGSVFDASAIYSRLADHGSQKVVYVDGLAASAASIVAMVGHKIYIRANAQMMVHLPSGLVLGNAEDMRKAIAALDSITESMINVYAKRTGLGRGELRDLMTNESWFTPELAVEKGFADEVRGVVKAAARLDSSTAIFNGVEFDVSRFHNMPVLAGSQPTKPKPMRKIKAAVTDDDEKDNDNGNGDESKEPKETPATETPPAAPPTPPSPPPAPPVKDPNAPEAPAEPKTAASAAVQAERQRVAALLELDRPATHAVVMAAVKDGRQVNDVIKDVMAAMDKAAVRSARHADASVLDGIAPSDGADDGDNKTFGALLTKKVQSRMKGRSNVLRRRS
jgi:ATP-dependent protease ClpP protease subunit